MRQKSHHSRQSHHTTTDNPALRRILVIDDDPGVQDIFRIKFEDAGFITDIRSDGTDILKNQFIIPDIFLIDKQLSGSSGLSICRWLKSRKATKDIPVIMISASPNIAQLSLNAGADNYIEKPFEIKVLIEMIERYYNAAPTIS